VYSIHGMLDLDSILSCRFNIPFLIPSLF
jgi:hypothetical protein